VPAAAQWAANLKECSRSERKYVSFDPNFTGVEEASEQVFYSALTWVRRSTIGFPRVPVAGAVDAPGVEEGIGTSPSFGHEPVANWGSGSEAVIEFA
jgi:hypothetical protein